MNTFLHCFVTVTAVFFTTVFVSAQSLLPSVETYPCLTDYIHQNLMERNSKYADTVGQFETLIYKKTVEKTANALKLAALPSITIPVVVHIVHNNGPENISDDEVIYAIDQLNNAFANTGSFTQVEGGVDTKIRFCLAKRTPDGTATTGITRTQSELTELERSQHDWELKNLSRWNIKKYMNVWVVRSIYDIPTNTPYLGYATLPFGLDSMDGIVLDYNAMKPGVFLDNVFPHEAGHYLGLYHTFERGCKNVDCLIDGDRVCDTPPDQGRFTSCIYNSCSTDTISGPFTTDVNDFTGNYMDYSVIWCGHSFTEGQKTRMNNAIYYNRYGLYDSNGCLPPCPITVSAEFTPIQATLAVGDSLWLHPAHPTNDQWEWYLDDVLVSTDSSFLFTGDSATLHVVRLVAFDSLPQCRDIKYGYIETVCNIEAEVIASNSYILPGNSATYTVNGSHYTSVSWMLNNELIGNGNEVIINFLLGGVHELKVLISNDLCVKEIVLNIEVQPACTVTREHLVYYLNNSTHYALHQINKMFDGGILLSGEDGNRPFIARLDSNFNVLWAKLGDFNTPVDAKHSAAFPTPDGGAVIPVTVNSLMCLLIKIDSMGNEQWTSGVDGYPEQLNFVRENHQYFTVLPDGNMLLVSQQIMSPNYRISLYKINPTGEIIWQKILRDTSLSYHGSVVGRSGGGYYVSIASDENNQVFRFNDQDQLVWNRKYQGGYYSSQIIEAAPDGGFVLAGMLPFSGIVVTRCDQEGSILWSRKYDWLLPGLSLRPINFIKKLTGADGGFLLGGPLGGAAKNSGILWKIKENGDVTWVKRFIQSDVAPHKYGVVGDALEKDNRILIGLNSYSEQYSAFRIAQAELNGYAGGCIENAYELTKTSYEMTSLTNPDTSLIMMIPATNQSFDAPLLSLNPLTKVSTCVSRSTCPEDCDNGMDDDGDGLADCYDKDCPCLEEEPCAAVAVPNPFAAKLAWKSDTLNSVNILAMPVLGNMNKAQDNIPDIAIYSAPKDSLDADVLVFRGDGSNQQSPKKIATISPASQWVIPAALTIADVNRDEHSELFYADKDFSYVLGRSNYYDPGESYNGVGTISTTSGLKHDWKLQVADLNHDGIPDIYMGNMICHVRFNSNGISFGRVIAAADVSLPHGHLAYNNFQYPSASSVATHLLSSNDCMNRECDGLELAAGPVIYSIDMTEWNGDGFRRIVQKDLNIIDPSPTIWSDGYTGIADINLDGRTDVIVSGKKDSIYGVYVWDMTGLIGFFPHPVNTPHSGGMPCVANVFDDRILGFAKDYPEIIAASENRLTCFNLNSATINPNAPYWWSTPTTDSTGYSAATAFDFNADGLDEIVFHDRTDLRIIYGGPEPLPEGVDSERNWFKYYAPTECSDQYPIVADCDGDNAAEILFTAYHEGETGTTRDLKGSLIVLEAADKPWTACHPVWNQYNYGYNNIDQNLHLYKIQPTPSTGFYGKKPYNKFLAQVPFLDDSLNAYIPLSDLTFTVDSLSCGDTLLKVSLKICNKGNVDWTDTLPVAFFKGVLADFTPELAIPIQFVHRTILHNSCEQFDFYLPLTSNPVRYYAILNTTDTVNPVYLNYQFYSEFPDDKPKECDYSNNFGQFAYSWEVPTLDLGHDTTLCNGNILILSPADSFKRFLWSDGSEENQFTAYSSGNYWVKAWDVCGFSQLDSIRIRPDTSHVIDLGNDLRICVGDTVVLHVGDFEQLSWTSAETVSCDTCPTIALMPQNEMVIAVSGTSGNCIANDEIKISLFPDMQLTGGSLPATNTEPNGVVWVTVNNGQPPYYFQWDTHPVQFNDTLPNVLSGTYRVTVNDSNGCSDTLAVIVEHLTSGEEETIVSNSIKITPIPARASFSVEWKTPKITDFQFTVFNQAGELIYTAMIKANSTKIIDCSGWPAGVYSLSFGAFDKIETRQITILAK